MGGDRLGQRIEMDMGKMERGTTAREIREEMLPGKSPAEDMKMSGKLDEFWTGA